MKQTMLKAALASALGVSSMAAVQTATAATATYNWEGWFTMLDENGAVLANTGITTKGANQFQTPVQGTMTFDQTNGAGTATVDPFFFFGTTPEKEASASGITMQAVGGTTLIANMLFNWNTTTGIPVSIVMDAAGFFSSTSADWADGMLTQGEVAGTGAAPVSDGIYHGNAAFNGGYLDLGPAIVATTADGVTLRNGCVYANCLNVAISGGLPIVPDTTPNPNDYDLSTPTFSDLSGDGIGGFPMQDGGFIDSNANFDITKLTFASQDANATIGPFDVGQFQTVIPVPAAVWLFGSGLLGLVGVARRKASS